MDPGNSIKYRFVPGRRRAPRQQGQQQLSGREIAAIWIRRQFHQRGNRQRRQPVDQQRPRGGVQEARRRLPAARGRPLVAAQEPERPPRPCRSAPPQLGHPVVEVPLHRIYRPIPRRPDPPQPENPVVETPLHRPQPGDEHFVHLNHNGWPRQPSAFKPLPQNGCPQPPLEGMHQCDWPVEYWGQEQPEQLPVDQGQQGDVQEQHEQLPVDQGQQGDVQPNQEPACRNPYGQPHEFDQRFCPEAGPIRDEVQELRDPPAETKAWPAESGADASLPAEKRDPEVPQLVGDQQSLVEPDGLVQLPVTEPTTEAPSPRDQTEAEGSKVHANPDGLVEPEGHEHQLEPLPSFSDAFSLRSLPSFRDTFLNRPAANPLRQETDPHQQAVDSAASSSAGQRTGMLEGDQALTNQTAVSAPKPVQDQVSVEPAALTPVNNDKPWDWDDVLEFLTDCGEI